MKKILTLGMVLALAVSIMFTACDNGGGGTTTTPDTTPPTVVSVTPNGTDVPIAGDVVITFSEAMDTTTLGTVKLNDIELTTPTNLGWGWSRDKKEFGINYTGLTNDTTYTVKISGFKDVAGNTMVDDNSHSFTTMVGIPPNA